MIPVEYRTHGERRECDALRGQARRVVLILDNMMRLGKLKQQEIRFTPYDGAIIIARKFFGRTIVDIYAGGGVPAPPPPAPLLCICNCNLSIGWILEVQVDDLGGVPLYTVMACNHDGTVYIPYPDVLASDFTPYIVGQKVVMIPYKQMAYLCCTDKTGGTDKVRGCTPYNVEDEYTKDDDEWRTKYRILPWCALTIPMKLSPTEWNHRG